MSVDRDDTGFWMPLLVDAFQAFLDDVDEAQARLAEKDSALAMESERARRVLARDRATQAMEERRKDAESAASRGLYAALQDAVMWPTPEWEAKGNVVAYTPPAIKGSAKSISTIRRRYYDSIVHLESRGALDKEQAHACRWFRELREMAQIDRSPSISGYGETIRGDRLYGHLPMSEWAAMVRADYRLAQRVIPASAYPAFIAVVIDNLPLEEAGRSIRRRKGMTRLHVQDGASALVSWLKARAKQLESEFSNAKKLASNEY